jgi:hypothetical protein
MDFEQHVIDELKNIDSKLDSIGIELNRNINNTVR